MGEVDWHGLNDSTMDGDNSVSSLLGMAKKTIRFKVKLQFFFIKHVNFDLESGSYFFSPSFSLFLFLQGGVGKKYSWKLGKLRETKFEHVGAKASHRAVPTCGVYLATWPVKKRIFAES